MSVREYLVRLVENDLGGAQDNLTRARAAFRGQDLSEKYGQSSQTKREILTGYEDWERRALEAKRWLDRGGGFDAA